MDIDIEWLFEEVYRLKKTGKEISFISDWDAGFQSSDEIQSLLKNVYQASIDSSNRYIFSYEQFLIKEQIRQVINQYPGASLSEDSLSISPNATISLYLALQSLPLLGIRRIMVVTPAYFSVHKSLEQLGYQVIYHHLQNDPFFSLQLNELEQKVTEQFIDCIIITDPVYSAGIGIEMEEYRSLVDLCNRKNILLIVDYSLGGLDWDSDSTTIIPKEKIIPLLQLERFLFIDSASKRLLLNGLKFSIIVGDVDTIDKIDRLAEEVYGALNRPQLELIAKLYSGETSAILQAERSKTIETLKNNYKLMKTAVQDSHYDLYPSNAGFFTVLFHKEIKLKDVDTRKFALDLLNNESVLALTIDRLSFYSHNQFGLRINIFQPIDKLLAILRKLIRLQC